MKVKTLCTIKTVSGYRLVSHFFLFRNGAFKAIKLCFCNHSWTQGVTPPLKLRPDPPPKMAPKGPKVVIILPSLLWFPKAKKNCASGRNLNVLPKPYMAPSFVANKFDLVLPSRGYSTEVNFVKNK